jgi:hypothetical protein
MVGIGEKISGEEFGEKSEIQCASQECYDAFMNTY